jgi:hypothetical protein
VAVEPHRLDWDCDDDVMDEVRIIPEPTFVNINICIAKMEFMLLASLARVCKAEKGAGG